MPLLGTPKKERARPVGRARPGNAHCWQLLGCDRNVIEPQEGGVLPESELQCRGTATRHHVMAGLCVREWWLVNQVPDDHSVPNHLEFVRRSSGVREPIAKLVGRSRSGCQRLLDECQAAHGSALDCPD